MPVERAGGQRLVGHGDERARQRGGEQPRALVDDRGVGAQGGGDGRRGEQPLVERVGDGHGDRVAVTRALLGELVQAALQLLEEERAQAGLLFRRRRGAARFGEGVGERGHRSVRKVFRPPTCLR